MQYIDLLHEIRDLGFEDDQVFSEYNSIIRNAITRACRFIATIIKAPTGVIPLDLTDDTVYTDTGRYDLAELSKDDDGNVRFDSVDRIVEATDTGGKTFLRYDIEQDKVLVLDPSIRTKLTVYYNERILPLPSDVSDSYEIQVVYPCEPLVALLAAHYVWLDDDERKAIIYWNEFDQLRAEIEAKAFKLKGRIVGGF